MSSYRFIQELNETTSSFFVPNPYFHWKIYYYIVCHRVPEASKRPSSEINDIGFYLYYSLYKIIHQLQSLSFQYTRCRSALYCFHIFCFLLFSDKLTHFFSFSMFSNILPENTFIPKQITAATILQKNSFNPLIIALLILMPVPAGLRLPCYVSGTITLCRVFRNIEPQNLIFYYSP